MKNLTLFVSLIIMFIAMVNSNRIENLRSEILNQLEAEGKTPTQDCILDVTKCPYYPNGQLTQCSNGNSGIVSNCNSLCNAILSGNAYSSRTIPACQIGCSYAANYFRGNDKGTPGKDCLFNCQYTVWTFQGGNNKCNYNNGLGISVPELDNFGAGKSCRIGCVLGNQDKS